MLFSATKLHFHKTKQVQKFCQYFLIHAEQIAAFYFKKIRKRTIPTKRPQPADEVSANFS
jgi:hypothetical protein